MLLFLVKNEDMQVSYINDSSRNVYMYELNDNFTAKHGRMTNMFTLTGIFSNNSQSQTKVFEQCSFFSV